MALAARPFTRSFQWRSIENVSIIDYLGSQRRSKLARDDRRVACSSSSGTPSWPARLAKSGVALFARTAKSRFSHLARLGRRAGFVAGGVFVFVLLVVGVVDFAGVAATGAPPSWLARVAAVQSWKQVRRQDPRAAKIARLCCAPFGSDVTLSARRAPSPSWLHRQDLIGSAWCSRWV